MVTFLPGKAQASAIGGVKSPPFVGALDVGLIGPKKELTVTGPSKFGPECKARGIDLYRSDDRTIADVAGPWGSALRLRRSVSGCVRRMVLSSFKCGRPDR